MPKVISSDIRKLPKKYKEMPRYPVITNGYEDKFKKSYHKMLNGMFLDLTKKMLG